jgi:hypothetical protein
MFLSKLIAAITALTREVIRLRKVIQLRRPGLVFVRMVSEGVNGMSRFALVLPTPGAADVVSREISLSINGGEPTTQTLAGDATESAEFDGQQGDIVTGSLVDIDDATPTPNRSEPSVFELELTDTIAPPQPGEVGVRMVSEG